MCLIAELCLFLYSWQLSYLFFLFFLKFDCRFTDFIFPLKRLLWEFRPVWFHHICLPAQTTAQSRDSSCTNCFLIWISYFAKICFKKSLGYRMSEISKNWSNKENRVKSHQQPKWEAYKVYWESLLMYLLFYYINNDTVESFELLHLRVNFSDFKTWKKLIILMYLD